MDRQSKFTKLSLINLGRKVAQRQQEPVYVVAVEVLSDEGDYVRVAYPTGEVRRLPKDKVVQI